MKLRVCTYNIHKGFSQFNRHLVIHELREGLRALQPDILFLQEVQGQHLRHARKQADWPALGQHEFIAQAGWSSAIYGGNAYYEHGHHGNAVLSRFPVLRWENRDISAHRFEHRGLLHVQMQLPGRGALHCLCVHLGLTGAGRRRQVEALIRHVRRHIPEEDALIVAGDFNDWRNQLNGILQAELALEEVFAAPGARPARSFPAALPLLRLDRIYIRGLSVTDRQVHSGRPWSHISDHAALSADLEVATAWH